MRRRLFNLAAALSLLALLALLGWRAFGGSTRTTTVTLWTLDTLVGTRTELQTDFGIHTPAVRLPFWPLVLVSLVVPIIWVLAALIRVFDPVTDGDRQRLVCSVCGYDLRATPDRCPECGTVPHDPPHYSPVQRTATASSGTVESTAAVAVAAADRPQLCRRGDQPR